MDRDIYLENAIKECLKESIDEYKDIDYDQYNDWSNGVSKAFGKWYKPSSDRYSTGIDLGNGGFPTSQGPATLGGDIIVYTAVDENALYDYGADGKVKTDDNGNPELGGILKNGFSRRYLGANGCCVGSGIYCTLNPTSRTSGYGKSMVKCILVDGLKGFIIFEKELREKFDGPGRTIADEIKDYCSKEQLDFLLKKYNKLEDIHSGGYSSRDDAENFLFRFRGNRFNSLSDDRRIPNASSDLREEDQLNGSGIRGFVYKDYYGYVVLVRDINSLIPYQYRLDRVNDHWSYAIKDKDTFDKINKNIDVYWKFSGRYPKTQYYETQKFGYAVVRDNKGYYLVNAITGKPVLDFPVESIGRANALDKTYDFKHRGKQYRIFLDEGEPYIIELEKSEDGNEMVPCGFPVDASDIQ